MFDEDAAMWRVEFRNATTEDLVTLRDMIEVEFQNRDLCEHGIRSGDWCRLCNSEMHKARREHQEQ